MLFVGKLPNISLLARSTVIGTGRGLILTAILFLLWLHEIRMFSLYVTIPMPQRSGEKGIFHHTSTCCALNLVSFDLPSQIRPEKSIFFGNGSFNLELLLSWLHMMLAVLQQEIRQIRWSM